MKNATTKRPVLIRADAGGVLGSGHIMRMIALAQALRLRDIDAVFASVQCHPSMLGRIQAEGFKHHIIENVELGDVSDAKQTIALAENLDCKWVFLDGYHFDFTYQNQIHAAGFKVGIMEDDDHCEQWCADLIVNQNIGAEGKTHSNILPKGQSLSGCIFVLLREEFIESPSQRKKSNWPPEHILMTMGGVDPDDATGLMLRCLEMLDDRALEVKVIVGGANPNKDRLEQLALESKHQVEILVDVTEMPALYQWADAAITAGGSTCYEWMCYGIPACVVTIAENQESIVDALSEQKAVHALGRIGDLSSEAAGAELREWVTGLQPDPIDEIVDVQGARRIAAYLDEQLTISIASAEHSWINPLIVSFAQTIEAKGHIVKYVNDASDAPRSDILFLLSYWNIVSPEVRARHTHTIVVHASNLPKGRGWSPVTWQILEGSNKIPFCLLEAVDTVDAGKVYLRNFMNLKGCELLEEIRQQQAATTFELCDRFIDQYPAVAAKGVAQEGNPSKYSRRSAKDSELDPNKTILEQFNKLRVADNDSYPAFFEIRGIRYTLKIELSD